MIVSAPKHQKDVTESQCLFIFIFISVTLSSLQPWAEFHSFLGTPGWGACCEPSPSRSSRCEPAIYAWLQPVREFIP